MQFMLEWARTEIEPKKEEKIKPQYLFTQEMKNKSAKPPTFPCL